jgi:hypothetical protein
VNYDRKNNYKNNNYGRHDSYNQGDTDYKNNYGGGYQKSGYNGDGDFKDNPRGGGYHKDNSGYYKDNSQYGKGGSSGGYYKKGSGENYQNKGDSYPYKEKSGYSNRESVDYSNKDFKDYSKNDISGHYSKDSSYVKDHKVNRDEKIFNTNTDYQKKEGVGGGGSGYNNRDFGKKEFRHRDDKKDFSFNKKQEVKADYEDLKKPVFINSKKCDTNKENEHEHGRSDEKTHEGNTKPMPISQMLNVSHKEINQFVQNTQKNHMNEIMNQQIKKVETTNTVSTQQQYVQSSNIFQKGANLKQNTGANTNIPSNVITPTTQVAKQNIQTNTQPIQHHIPHQPTPMHQQIVQPPVIPQTNPHPMQQNQKPVNTGYYLHNVQNMQNIQNYSFNNYNIGGFGNGQNPQHLQNNMLTNYYNNNVAFTNNALYNMSQMVNTSPQEIKHEDFDVKEFSDKLNLNAKVFVPKKKVRFILTHRWKISSI